MLTAFQENFKCLLTMLKRNQHNFRVYAEAESALLLVPVARRALDKGINSDWRCASGAVLMARLFVLPMMGPAISRCMLIKGLE
jgi:hypothetical protein